MINSVQKFKKLQKTISSIVVLSFAVHKTYETVETWLAKKIVCLRNALAVGSLFILQYILQISPRNYSVENLFSSLHFEIYRLEQIDFKASSLCFVVLIFLAFLAALHGMVTVPLFRRAGARLSNNKIPQKILTCLPCYKTQYVFESIVIARDKDF